MRRSLFDAERRGGVGGRGVAARYRARDERHHAQAPRDRQVPAAPAGAHRGGPWPLRDRGRYQRSAVASFMIQLVPAELTRSIPTL